MMMLMIVVIAPFPPLYEHPMINCPEILREVEHWAGGFLGPEQPPYH
jgi:hypothetical protein